MKSFRQVKDSLTLLPVWQSKRTLSRMLALATMERTFEAARSMSTRAANQSADRQGSWRASSAQVLCSDREGASYLSQTSSSLASMSKRVALSDDHDNHQIVYCAVK